MSALHAFSDVIKGVNHGYAYLLTRITLAYRDGFVTQRLAINGDAKGCARFILAAIPTPYIAFFVVKTW